MCIRNDVKDGVVIDTTTPEEVFDQITILVISYRQSAWVAQCLDSCARQSVPVRIIVIDDASDDGCADVVRKWSRDNCVNIELVAHADNVGLGASLSEGLSLIETPFFAYIAGDDWMEPDRAATQLFEFDTAGEECVLVYSDCYRADAEENRFNELFSEGEGVLWKPGLYQAFDELLDHNWIPAPTVMIRTASLRRVGGYDSDLFYEDHDSYLRLARAGEFRCVPTPLATHRELTSSLGHRMFFFDEAADMWTRAKIKIYLKHLGHCGRKDSEVAQRIAVWAVACSSQDPRHLRK